MSDYYSDALVAKDRLETVSDSFCLAKWQQVSLHLTTGHTNSCYHPPLHKIPLDSIKKNPSALHNTEHKKQQRKLMVEGQNSTEHGPQLYHTTTLHILWASEGLFPTEKITPTEKPSGVGGPHYTRISNISE